MNLVSKYLRSKYVLLTNISEDTRFFLGNSLKPGQSIMMEAGTVNTIMGMVEYSWIRVSSEFTNLNRIVSRVVKSDGRDNDKRHGKLKAGVGYVYEINRAASI